MKRVQNQLCGTLTVMAIAAFPACGGGSAAPAPLPAPAPAAQQDTAGLIPAGLGSLHQEDISVNVSANGLNVEAIPLAEDFIRTLSPDSYAGLLRIRESKRAQLDTIARRTGLARLSVWRFTFRNVQQGEAPFNARDVIITNQNRDYKPVDVIGITPGFGDQRVPQREVRVGLIVFNGELNPNQPPLTLTIGTQTGGGNWQTIVQRVEAERGRIRSRASARGGVR